MEFYNKVEKFVEDSFKGDDAQIKHFKRTVYWIKKLKPGADEALLISAIAHDIERAFRKKDMLKIKIDVEGYDHKDFIRPHEERGAEIIGNFLKKHGANQELIDRVKMLVSRHEEGGNEDQNLLKDADSVSFFENNIPHFLTKKIHEVGKEKVRKKFNWMFNRISYEKSKNIVKDWYEKAIIDLEKTK